MADFGEVRICLSIYQVCASTSIFTLGLSYIQLQPSLSAPTAELGSVQAAEATR